MMTQSPEQLYLESRVYTSTPEELIQMIYETALESVHRGIEAVESGDIETRARAITKASSCVMELAGSLNVEAGGELGVRLAVLYEYLLHELLEANVHQNAAPLRDCERVLRSLLEGWTAALSQLERNASIPAEDGKTSPFVAVNAFEPGPAPPPHLAPTIPTFGIDSDDLDPFDIESLEPAINSWCG